MIGLYLFTAAVALLAAAALYQRIGSVRDRKRFPPAGRILELPGGPLHFLDQGSGTPAVVLEAGLAATTLSWSYVQSRAASFTRVVSYDRAGLGESGSCTERALDEIVADLKALLERAQIPGPYVLAGHSFGGLVIRAFAHRYASEIAGLVFVDPVSIQYWAQCSELDRRRLTRGVKLSRRGARLASFGVVRFAIGAVRLGSGRIGKWIARASAGKATPMLGRLAGEVQKLPSAVIPAVCAHWSNPKSFRGMAAYLACLPDAAREAAGMRIPPGVPFLVLSAGTATEGEIAEREEWVANSALGRHIRVRDTGHWLQLERPELVVEAIEELVASYRAGTIKTPQ